MCKLKLSCRCYSKREGKNEENPTDDVISVLLGETKELHKLKYLITPHS